MRWAMSVRDSVCLKCFEKNDRHNWRKTKGVACGVPVKSAYISDTICRDHLQIVCFHKFIQKIWNLHEGMCPTLVLSCDPFGKLQMTTINMTCVRRTCPSWSSCQVTFQCSAHLWNCESFRVLLGFKPSEIYLLKLNYSPGILKLLSSLRWRHFNSYRQSRIRNIGMFQS
jgi:hypothetical protein